jgi:hypothetical protein
MGLGGFPLMQYDFAELLNQYSLLGVALVVLVLGAAATRWRDIFR